MLIKKYIKHLFFFLIICSLVNYNLFGSSSVIKSQDNENKADPNIAQERSIFNGSFFYETAITSYMRKILLGYPSDFLKIILSSPKLNIDEYNLKREFKKLLDDKSGSLIIQQVIELLRKAGMKE